MQDVKIAQEIVMADCLHPQTLYRPVGNLH